MLFELWNTLLLFKIGVIVNAIQGHKWRNFQQEEKYKVTIRQLIKEREEENAVQMKAY